MSQQAHALRPKLAYDRHVDELLAIYRESVKDRAQGVAALVKCAATSFDLRA